ncbi:MAG TPA: HAD-IB family hydrolase [Mucilaginibacter sp.]|nr:HAD-IB family hydrolase [Mucilaginibacter sp.]
MKKIAFFDFDGTITFKDSLFEMIRYSRGAGSFYLGLLVNAPYLVAFKLKLISNQRTKERILKYFFSGTGRAAFQQSCDDFADEILPGIIRPLALEEISKLKNNGFEVVVVSASPEHWIKKWADYQGLVLIGTRLQMVDDCVTGLIDGTNNNGEEKASRILGSYNLKDYTEIVCYGDTEGDRAMLALGTQTFYRPFRS